MAGLFRGEDRGSYRHSPVGGIDASSAEGRGDVGEDVEGLPVHRVRGAVSPVRGARGDGVLAGAGRPGSPRGPSRFRTGRVLVVEVDRGASRRGTAGRVRPD